MSGPLDRVLTAVRKLPGVAEGRSRFGGGAPAFSTGGREFFHVHSPTRIDVRVGRAAGRALALDPRVLPRASPSDWVELRVETSEGVAFAIELARRAHAAAAAAARPGGGVP